MRVRATRFSYVLFQRQQMGRAGRRARDALTVLVADERPIDQHYVNNPEELFSTVCIDWILRPHIG